MFRRPLGDAVGTLRRTPRAALTCALIASLSAACWSVITPPFQGTDEPSHFAYAQQLAETWKLPTSSSAEYSPEEETALHDLHQQQIQWHPEVHTISSPAAVEQLRRDLTLPLARYGPGGAGVAASEPPLFYALETIPYYLESGGTILDRLELMRLLSALMAGVTALFVFMFIRELLPGTPWAWTSAGLAAAVTPLLGVTSGVVTPDAMLFAVSAAIFFCLARAFRRGLTRKMAVALGALIAVGFLTKVNFVGLVPGIMLGLVILGVRGGRETDTDRPRHAFGSMALGIAIGVSPICVYGLSNLLDHHYLLGLVSRATHQASGREAFGSEVSYIWQLYLPRLPGMTNYFPGLSTMRQIWFDRAVGLYGWLDTTFPVWVYNFALVPAGLIALLLMRTLITRRAALRAHLPELLVYLAMGLGLMVLIGGDSDLHRTTEGAGYAQPRYLVPLLPLAAAMLALAARGAGRRWGPAVGALIVVLFLAQDIFSQLLVVSRFFG
jgi:4-amino-4-deoxy-L-arabinose transferase-like glycosyltransferase